MEHSQFQQGFIRRVLLIAVLGIGLFVWGLTAFVAPPSGFPQNTTFAIIEGESLGGVAYRLKQENIIKSPQAFKIIMLLLGNERHLSVGEYRFDRPTTSIEVALKISGKNFDILQNRVTFPEGFTNKEIAARLAAHYPGFDTAGFLELAKNDQGYLFPDTYGFPPEVTPTDVITALKKNFLEKTLPLETDLARSVHPKKDIITMASIIEREANDGPEANIVAGILWKRIELGIPLQVDAPFLFLLGKTSAELTAKDLTIDSPYNTYKYKGLPPGPINNPGIAAIKAALYPASSPYLYYLHDTEGVIHYARTHDEHLENKKKYLQ